MQLGSRKGWLLLVMAYTMSCNFAHHPDFPNIPEPAGEGWTFEDRYWAPTPPVLVYIEKFKYSSQLLPTTLAMKYISYNMKCNPFKITENRDGADIIIEDHQTPDWLTGDFLRPDDDGASVMADTQMFTKGFDGAVYIIRVFSQESVSRQTELLAHELLHSLGIGHNEDVNDIMYPLLTEDRKNLALAAASVKALNTLYCRGNMR